MTTGAWEREVLPPSAEATGPETTPSPTVTQRSPRQPGEPSGTVRAVLTRAAPRDSVVVTELIDDVLRRHGDYLVNWPVRERSWPIDGVRQTPARWLEEARALLFPRSLFGRATVIAWALLDDAVAAEAVASGLLGGLASEITPSLAAHLTPAGVDLLRRRAPLVALQEEVLEPVVDLQLHPELGVRALALDRPPPTSGTVGRWAVAYEDRVVVGREGSSWKVYPEDVADPPGSGRDTLDLAQSTDSGSATRVVTIGWSRRGRLTTILSSGRHGGLVSVRARATSSDWHTHVEPWPDAELGAVSEDGLVLTTRSGSGQELLWGVTDPGGPVPVATLTPPATLVAVAGGRVAAITDDGSLHVAQRLEDVHGPVVGHAALGQGPRALAATGADVVVGFEDGVVLRLPWDAPGGKPRAVQALRGAPVSHLHTGGAWVAVASDTEPETGWGAAVLNGPAMVARWRPGAVSAIALSADGHTLGVCGDDRLRIWRVDRAAELRLTSYLADSPTGADLLGIRPAVGALAALATATVVEPPLAVGLFGAWGSGKTFFMRQLQQQVEEIAAQSRASGRPQSALWAWRSVRQVEFNAWHYGGADVWAGLLEHLIRSISIPGAATGLLGAETEASAARLAEAEARAEAAREQLHRAEVEGARGILADTADELLGRLDSALTAGGMGTVGRHLSTTAREVAGARQTLRDVGWLTPGTRQEMVRATRRALLIAVPVFALVTIALVLVPGVPAAVWAPLASLVGLAAGAATWVREKTQHYAERVAAVTRAEQLLHEAEQEVAEVLLRAEGATVGSLLNDYLHGRNASEDYRASLGLIGTVHRDLRTISDAVTENNAALLRPPAQGTGRHAQPASVGRTEQPVDDAVNRVVLYIDDLDRCRPEIVVKVLEAVSMLLSFKMFIVVVAVDAHWVSTSLATVYPTLLKGGEVSADNYLEKIFQLPVWLDRPGPEAASAMAAALLDLADEPGATSDGDETGTHPAGQAVGTAGGEPGADAPGRPSGIPTAPPADPGVDAAGGHGTSPPRAVVLATSPPAPVTLETAESRAIAALAPMLARSPRALKRYINTYRLLKGLIDEEHLEVARLLLAVATGRPDAGERLLREIAQAPPEATLGELVERWPADDRDWFTTSVPAGLRTWSSWTAEDLQPAVQTVRRFVFRTVTPSTW